MTNHIDISYLLPTCRAKKYPEILQSTIDSINSQPTNLSYEILVYSTDKVIGDHVKWIKENKRQGPIFAINTMAQKFASGNYFVSFSDDIVMLNSIDLCINMLKSEYFQRRKYKICSLGCGNSCPLSSTNDGMGNVEHIREVWPKGNIVRWPVVHRDTVNNYLNGYIFHPQFYHAAGDIWLGYYLAANNEPSIEGPTQLSPSPTLSTQELHNPSFEIQDCNTVVALVYNYMGGKKYYVNMTLQNKYKGHIDASDLFVQK